MGAETIAAGLVAGSAIYGASRARKAGKRADILQQEQANATRLDRARVQRDQETLARKTQQTQRKIAVGQARTNRSRLRGGVFGENEATPRNLTPTLG